MTPQRTLDVSDLPAYSISSEAPLWWGQLMLAFIEGSMFAILIAMYFYYRLRLDVWPPPGTQLPHVLLPSIGLALLVVSCLGTYLASEAAKQGDRWMAALWLIFNLVFAIAALILRGFEWATFNFNQATDVHGSIFWTILGLHTLDAIADIFFTIALAVLLFLGYFGHRQRLGVHVDSVVWYFVVISWIPLYVVLYWGPRFVGAP